MTETLGPIHYMMYEKIKYQDVLTRHLLEDRPELLAELDRRLPPVSLAPLDTLIDQENIHGWLSARIDVVEGRLAFALAKTADFETKLRQAGAQARSGSAETVDGLYDQLKLHLLDGMPCDAALTAVREDSGVRLVQAVELHDQYAEELLGIDPADSLDKTCAGGHDHDDHDAMHLQEASEVAESTSTEGEPSTFYRARQAWLEGFVEGSPYQVERLNQADFLISR